ncbi:hypothetical protein Adt_05861 [Abeliophyllum distichum]|uniref:Netrin receptor DCC n=1 Tax=Abeliophyllum distichum TaxID=126358 RepID=A0ABD1V599_9LAMI
MPIFSTIALDRLIEPGTSEAMMPGRSPESKLDSINSSLNLSLDRGIVAPNVKLERGVSVPPNPKLDGRKGASSAVDRKHHRTQILPALYATPESTPLPDSPSSFPPSPYVINHKRRGPRLIKSFSEDDVATRKRALDENGESGEKEVAAVAKDDSYLPMEVVNSGKDDNCTSTVPRAVSEEYVNGSFDGAHGNSNLADGLDGRNGVKKSVIFNSQKDGERDDFFDPHESMSVKSNGESEGNGVAERSLNSITPMAEFYDAWEELSSESGLQPPLSDIETELREIRLSLLMEIEKRKQAEEILNSVRNQWQRIREQLSLVGLTLPADPTTLPEDKQLVDPAEELCQQIYLVRFVSNSIGRGTAKALVEMEMEAQLKSKNFEIARLWDRLHYYEAVNHEMSQRNQETIETARRLRQKRKRRQRWVLGSITAAISLGSAILAWSYFQTGKGSSSSSLLQAPEVEHRPKQ